MSIPKRVRRFLLLNWAGLMTGFLVSYWMFDWPLMLFIASNVGAFGIGVLVIAYALADDYRQLQRAYEEQVEVNKKIVARSKRTAERKHYG